MSSSDPGGQARFALTLPNHPDLRVTVYDGRNRIVSCGRGSPCKVLDLLPGLYTVRVEAHGLAEERIVSMTQAVDLSAMQVARRSAIPLADSALYSTCYADAARDASLNRSAAPLASSGHCDASLLVFVRAARPETAIGPVGKGLALLDGRAALLSTFSERETAGKAEAGWMAYSVDAPAGMYLLASAQTSREVVIGLFPGMQTRVFILDNGRPALETMRVLIEPRAAPFDPNSASAQATDAALENIMNHASHLPTALMEQVVGQTSANPLLRLIAAYSEARRLLSRREPWAAGEADLAAFDASIDALARSLPGCPDVSALHLLRGEAVGQTPRLGPLPFPPMFRLGMEAVLRATLNAPALIGNGSFLDQISDRMLSDSPWTSWTRLALPAAAAWRSGTMPDVSRPPGTGGDAADADWLQEYLLAVLKRRVVRKLSDSDDRLSLAAIAGAARTTPGAVRRSLERLIRSLDAGQPLRAHPELTRWLRSNAGKDYLLRLLGDS